MFAHTKIKCLNKKYAAYVKELRVPVLENRCYCTYRLAVSFYFISLFILLTCKGKQSPRPASGHAKILLSGGNFLFCFFSFIIKAEIWNCLVIPPRRESAVKCLSQGHSRMVRIGLN